ncbi:hypothetical protein [Marivita geojedonensis]|uniref:hypothetical protein n=1 Tax=Marivita geojedonensis TaxID=1123756 RepID=UPI001E380C90|nr:hypothetical protein [Marivita geojedonensis]
MNGTDGKPAGPVTALKKVGVDFELRIRTDCHLRIICKDNLDNSGPVGSNLVAIIYGDAASHSIRLAPRDQSCPLYDIHSCANIGQSG